MIFFVVVDITPKNIVKLDVKMTQINKTVRLYSPKLAAAFKELVKSKGFYLDRSIRQI